jgi:hypothetical protein
MTNLPRDCLQTTTLPVVIIPCQSFDLLSQAQARFYLRLSQQLPLWQEVGLGDIAVDIGINLATGKSSLTKYMR